MPDNLIQNYVVDDTSNGNESVIDYSQLTDVNNSIGQAAAEVPTLRALLSDPSADPEEVFRQLAQTSDEWGEKYLDYLLEKKSLAEANAYTASREDSAYSRLVNDLRNAGLNPMMMFGNSASISAGPSQGYIKQTEGANSRAIKLTLAYLQTIFKAIGTLGSTFKNIGSFFGL